MSARYLQDAYAASRRMRYEKRGVAEHRRHFSHMSHASDIIGKARMQPEKPDEYQDPYPA